MHIFIDLILRSSQEENPNKLDLTIEEARAVVTSEARLLEGCGLKIYEWILKNLDGDDRALMDRMSDKARDMVRAVDNSLNSPLYPWMKRSEERRVGKECPV